MIRAWRREDGRYRLEFPTPFGPLFGLRMRIEALGGRNETRDWSDRAKWNWAVPEAALAELDIPKVFGVVAGPSSCGCEPAMFRWVTEGEVEAGRTSPGWCPHCKAAPGIQGHFHQCVIVDVCGEADVAEAVYQAEFAEKVASAS